VNDLDLIEEVLSAAGTPKSSGRVSASVKAAKRTADASASAFPPARRGMARQKERAGLCSVYAPFGTTCKVCGKVHPV
jgi:hypothetical protein